MLPVGFLNAVREEVEAELEQVLLHASPWGKENQSHGALLSLILTLDSALVPWLSPRPLPSPSNLAGKGG